MPELAPDTVVFDLGGVLIDWNPRHLYRKLFGGDDAAMERFLSSVCTPAWNERQDEGRSFAEAEAELIARHPHQAALIRAWCARFDEMMAGPVGGTVEILTELRARRTPLYALSNWSRETFPFALGRFDFLGWFDGRVISGEIGMKKPDPRIYRHLLDRFGVTARRAVFIDDSPPNAAAAESVGMRGLRFTSPSRLRQDLAGMGLL